MSVFTAVGLLGPLLFVIAYSMIALGKWNTHSLKCYTLNFFGAVAMLLSLSHDWNMPTFVLECCWCGISLYGVVKVLRERY